MSTTIFYRSCGDTEYPLYRVVADFIPSAPGGGFDLSTVPAGTVNGWDGSMWVRAALPPVGTDAGHVRHTKNTAGTGVPKPLPRADEPAAVPPTDVEESLARSTDDDADEED